MIILRKNKLSKRLYRYFVDKMQISASIRLYNICLPMPLYRDIEDVSNYYRTGEHYYKKMPNFVILAGKIDYLCKKILNSQPLPAQNDIDRLKLLLNEFQLRYAKEWDNALRDFVKNIKKALLDIKGITL